MSEIKLIKPDKVGLLDHHHLTEKWVQDVIAHDPSILGLGDLILKDKERLQPRAGRLDLLFQDPESERRYEVEIQLGKVDESHIIRTVEYWDVERKRYPQYEHCAVIVAEDITSRFLNVISLLNGNIPLIAIQMNAYKHDDNHWLTFTTVLNETNLGVIEEEDEREVTDRAYWERQASPQTVATADEILKWVNEFAPGYQLKYNKFYIGLAKDGRSNNFIAFRPKRSKIHLEIAIEKNDQTDRKLEDAGLDLLEYSVRYGKYRLSLNQGDLMAHKDLIVSLMSEAFLSSNK